MASERESSGEGLKPAPPAVAESLVDREARNPALHYLLHLGLPVTASLLVHFGLLGFLALKSFNVLARTPVDVGEYEASLVESAAGQDSSMFDWARVDPLDSPELVVADDSIDNLDGLEVGGFDFGEPDLDSSTGEGLGEGEGAGLGIGDGPLALLGTGAGAGGPGTGGFGSALAGGGARIGRAGIWDLRIEANKVAYVVDFSGSIIVAVDELKRELKRSIGRLMSSQSFNVIVFYSTGAGHDERVRTEAFRSQLEPADAQTRREFFGWVDRKAPRGATHPLQAMKRALALEPEAIFFFSDGYFDDAIVSEITAANRSVQARIYCLVFDELLLQDTSELPRETEGARRLKRIAEANGGKVKIVTGKDLTR